MPLDDPYLIACPMTCQGRDDNLRKIAQESDMIPERFSLENFEKLCDQIPESLSKSTAAV